MTTKDVIADSTFYICFLDDIEYPDGLKKIFLSKKFEFIIGPVVEAEIRSSKNYYQISECLSRVRKHPLPFRYGEIVRPFLGIEEIRKGEHEVIGIAIVYYLRGIDFILILDDNGPRKVIAKRLAGIKSKMTGTVGFVKLCCCHYKIYSIQEAKNILEKIKNSKFRVPSNIVDDIIREIHGRCLE